MIQITKPVAASRKWLRIRGGRIFVPGSRPCCMPPRESQVASKTNPPPAVATHAINAAHSIRSTSLRTCDYPVRHVRITHPAGLCPKMPRNLRRLSERGGPRRGGGGPPPGPPWGGKAATRGGG